jgi:large subunit ribosomal protein L11
MKTAPASFLLKKAAGLPKGGTTPGKGAAAGSVTRAQCVEIAKLKMKDLNAEDIDAAARMIEGSARSIGLTVVD